MSANFVVGLMTKAFCAKEKISIHGNDISYRRSGQGPAILFIHGIAGSSRTWRFVLPELANEYSVIAPDLLGHGNSAKPPGDYSLGAYASSIRDFLAAIDVSRATIVGQSFGGGVALQLAYQYPELCERLVLVDSGGLGKEVSWLLRIFTLPAAEYLMPALFPGFLRSKGDALNKFFYDKGLRSPKYSEIWAAYASLTDSENRAAFVRILKAVIEPGGQSVSAMDKLYLAAHLPTLIVWGDKDEIIPVSHAYRAHEAITGSRLEIIQGAGHFPHVENPEKFTEILRDFMLNSQPACVSYNQLGNGQLRGAQ